jgi:hypothetical protein
MVGSFKKLQKIEIHFDPYTHGGGGAMGLRFCKTLPCAIPLVLFSGESLQL